jgi:ABC-2 type transport system ATP-binding protein
MYVKGDAHMSISISVQSVKKVFGRSPALDGVTLDFSPGLMHGVIGPEGAGKTTLLRILLGLLKPTEGSIAYFYRGEHVAFESIRPSVAYMPQTQSLYPDLSIGEHLEFFRELYGIPHDLYEQKRDELLRITRLHDFTERPAGQLSGGMYKKLGLMCALLRSPQVMLLDEPTTGVDPISRREFWDLLYRLVDQQILILVTTAYMDEAERCGRVNLLERGKLVAAGEPQALLQSEGVPSFDELFLRRNTRE